MRVTCACPTPTMRFICMSQPHQPRSDPPDPPEPPAVPRPPAAPVPVSGNKRKKYVPQRDGKLDTLDVVGTTEWADTFHFPKGHTTSFDVPQGWGGVFGQRRTKTTARRVPPGPVVTVDLTSDKEKFDGGFVSEKEYDFSDDDEDGFMIPGRFGVNRHKPRCACRICTSRRRPQGKPQRKPQRKANKDEDKGGFVMGSQWGPSRHKLGCACRACNKRRGSSGKTVDGTHDDVDMDDVTATSSEPEYDDDGDDDDERNGDSDEAYADTPNWGKGEEDDTWVPAVEG